MMNDIMDDDYSTDAAAPRDEGHAAPTATRRRTATAPPPTPLAQRLFVRHLELPCRIGVHQHERNGPQRVRIDVDLEMKDPRPPHDDALREVVSYDDIVAGIRGLTEAGHINLVETLADRIADLCLGDTRVGQVRVAIEKLDVFGDQSTVGVEIERRAGG